MGDYLEHDLDHRPPTKFFLPPLPEPGFAPRSIPRKPSPPVPSTTDAEASTSTSPALAAAIEHRRQIYSDNLYARHVAANEWTGYRRTLTPRDVVSDRERALSFLERELRVWAPPHDAPRLAQHLVKLLSAIDVRSSAAVRMLEPLVGDTFPNAAEHLVHELAAFLRSPFPLEVWDDVVQYGNANETYPEARRGRGRSRSRSRAVSERSDSRSGSKLRPRDGGLSPSSSSSRSRSRSRSRLRDDSRRDSVRPRHRSKSPPTRRWDQADSWVDPEFRPTRRGGRRERERREAQQNGRDESRKGHELLDRLGPSQPQAQPQPQAFHRAVAGAGIVIRGAAERRQSLLERLDRERLARAQAEGTEGQGQEVGQTEKQGQGDAAPASAGQSPASGGDTASPASNGHAAGGNRAAELREKLLAERKTRQLREQLLARKRARNAIAEAAEDVKTRARRKSGASAGGGLPGSTSPAVETHGSSPAKATSGDAEVAPDTSAAANEAGDAAPAPPSSGAPDAVAQEA